MKYFVSGGAGFVGSHLVDKLLAGGNQVTVYDNFSSGQKGFIEHHLKDKNFKLVEADILDFERLKEAITGHDLVFHLASNPDIAKGIVQTDLDIKQGTLLAYNVLEAMRVTGVKKIAYASGSGVYGNVGRTKTSEGFGPLLPVSMYGASKLACEGLISAFSNLFDMQSWIFRPANITGGRSTHGVVLAFIQKLKKNPKELEILGDGTQTKSYIHVTDLVESLLFCIQNAKERVNVFNIASNDVLDVKSIAGIVVKKMGLKDVKYKFTGGRGGWKGDVPDVMMDIIKIKRLGWSAKLPSREAVERAASEILGER